MTSEKGRLTGPKRELWLAWYVTVAFYGLYSVIFFAVARVQPPGRPWLAPDQTVDWFADRHWGLLVGFALIFVLGGFSAVAIALITYSIRRMSVSPVFAYSYLILYAVSAVPGFMFICVAMTCGAMRPERDPTLQQWLYDLGFLSFVGTMGVFLIGSLVWMMAILLDENRVFPVWFGLLNLCNALTEVVIAPSWIFQRGVLAYNGAIGFWVNVPVFGIYTAVFIVLLRNVIQREDFGTGPLPEPPPDVWRRARPPVEAVTVTAIETLPDDAAGEGADGAERFPGHPDMWLFVVFESLVFTSYFCIYLYARTQHEQAFLEAQAALTPWLGTVDTILLLTSSWVIARCVQHARAGEHRAAQRDAIVTTGLGAAFLALKIVEWVHLVRGGHTFTSSEFMQHFFFLTGIHAVHLLFGFVVLGVVINQLSGSGRRSQPLIETCSTYWHTIDLFWVVIFALLYVVR